MPKEQKDSQGPESDMQAIGHQLGSLASVLVVAAVQFGIPLTPGQQSSILSVIAVAWALFATIYGIRHRIPRRTANDDQGDITPMPQPTATQRGGPPDRPTTDINHSPTDGPQPRQMP